MREIERGPAGGSHGGGERRMGGALFRPDQAPRRPAWLEPDEDDEDSEVAGLATGRILTVLVGGLVLLAGFAAGAFWLLDAPDDPAIVADGIIIAAPEGPYKVRPADPGGAKVAGTGDSSFAVAEGEVREGTIAEEVVAAPAEGGIGVQIGAFASREEASAAWGRLGVRIPALAGRSHRVVEGSADSGAIFRLQAVAGSLADAAALCTAIRAEGGDCQVKQ